MNATQAALQGQTETTQTASQTLQAITQRAAEVYEALRQQAKEQQSTAQRAAEQRQTQQKKAAYRDMLTAYNPLGLQMEKPGERTGYAQNAAYNTFTADQAFYAGQKEQAKARAGQAYTDTLARLDSAEASALSDQQSRTTKLIQAYIKKRLALLKQAAKKEIDTFGV